MMASTGYNVPPYPDNSYEFNTYDTNSNLKTYRKRDSKTLTHYYDNLNLTTNSASDIICRVVSNSNFQRDIPTEGNQAYDVNSVNQCTAVDGNSINYDLTGNLVSHDGWSYI